MGNDQSKAKRIFNEAERNLDWEGKLYNTIDDVWNRGVGENFSHAYLKAKATRADHKPEMYIKAFQIHYEAGAAADQAAEQFKSAFGTVSTHSFHDGGGSVEVSLTEPVDKKRQKSRVKPLKPSERMAEKISITGASAGASKAHLIPDDKACSRHWGNIVELVSGYTLDNNNKPWRKEITEKIAATRANKLVLNGNHQTFYDHLGKGVLLVIPLLSPTEIADWDHGKPYEALVVCDSPYTYREFAATTEMGKGSNWATVEDLKLATSVLADNVKILADSLVSNWDYHQEHPRDWRTDSMAHLKASGQVLVPNLAGVHWKNLKLHPWRLCDSRLKLLKIDLGQVYNGDTASRIPDPWLLAFKAATSWSYVAYGKFQNKILKLLPGRSCDADDSSTSSASNEYGLPKMTAAGAERILQAKKLREENELRGLCLEFATPGEGNDDDLSVSTISSTDARNIPIVSDYLSAN